jgi:hypothetical protein
MPKKSLLNESQVRQFMKLASLEPLTPGFVSGLRESGKYRTDDDIEESHGRGLGENPPHARLEEEEPGPGELDLDAGDDLEDDSLVGDEEAETDELEAGAELGAEEPADADGGRMISVDGLLTALEGFLEDQLDQEVEIDSTEMDMDVDDEEAVDDLDVDAADMEADTDMEMDDEMLEEADDADATDADPEEEKKKKTDELVEQITKRVAARILKSALAKKK